jgi:DDE superfamily endonuclease
MAGIIDHPQVVQDALRDFYTVFPNDPQRRHFAEYLTGLFVAEHKTVLGIHREFARITDQSCLNRFLTGADWDPERLNRRRLELLQRDPDTRYAGHGVIAIDNVLIDHDGYLIPDAGFFWDHAEQRYKVAQDYLFANYVCPSGKHYPLHFRRFCPEDLCEALEKPFRSHTELCIELIDWVCGQPADAATAAGPCVGMGLPEADDHRRGLPGGAAGDAAEDPDLGHRPGDAGCLGSATSRRPSQPRRDSRPAIMNSVSEPVCKRPVGSKQLIPGKPGALWKKLSRISLSVSAGRSPRENCSRP